VNYPDMGGAVSNYGFAVASTDTGHEAPGLIGTFAVNNTESVIDFGHRAVHLSTVFAKNAVRAFYGARAHKSYWIGCSSGGKQGLKEAQAYPGDYDGVLAGSPAWYWSHLSAWTIQSALLNPQGPGYVSFAAFATLHASIIRQCDALDGLQDGIVTNPAVCHIDWAATGLTPAQQVQAAKQYQNWTSPLTGKLIFPAYSLGAEETGLAGAATGSFPFTEDYYKYEVLNVSHGRHLYFAVPDLPSQYTSIANYTFTSDKLAKLVQVADATNPGGTTANDFDMSPFFNRGGKLLHYVGTQDAIIPYGSVRARSFGEASMRA
jgi:feruloyl esterase